MDQATPIAGLSPDEVSESRARMGTNRMESGDKTSLFPLLKGIITEPMFLLLIAAAAVYFIVGQYQEGFIMVGAMCLVSGISLFQEYRSRSAIQALRKMAAAKARVIRGGKSSEIPADDLVTNDILLIEEGEILAADGLILECNDLSLNESVLTGEAFPVRKTADGQQKVYKGTLVTSGRAQLRVTAVGNQTQFDKIGLSLQKIKPPKTPLQVQIRSFVKFMVIAGLIAFCIVVVLQYLKSHDWIDSLLHGLTLAMSILPEEIPVAFSTFQALGAFRLLRSQVIVKQPQYVETLGAATVICADKTGTLTQNRMKVVFLYDVASGQSIPSGETAGINPELLSYAMWSSETQPFDPMEVAIHELYTKAIPNDLRALYKQVHEYPIGGKPPKMTHIFQNASGETLIAVKGAPEGILNQTDLDTVQRTAIEKQAMDYARQGLRVLGVGKGIAVDQPWPASQDAFKFQFLGLVAFEDPPKDNIRQTINVFREAGIRVNMITGDYPETALSIAAQCGLDPGSAVLTGQEVLDAPVAELQEKVKTTTIYARMFPDAKLKVIEALRSNGEVVAMTGDGVNDAPALKAAHIGIAMGKRGSEVAKAAASLILTDDDLWHMTEAVALGRRMYDNLKKAVRYIVSIHIPIIAVVMVPLIFGWTYDTLFSPLHVIFLELIMGPTCSIIYENEPMEKGTLQQPPRAISQSFLNLSQLSLSIVQGLVISLACLGPAFFFMQQGSTEAEVRTMVFITLLLSNIFLTLSNRSFTFPIWQTIAYKNRLVPLILLVTILFIALVLWVPYLRELFSLSPLTWNSFAVLAAAAAVGTLWIELVKVFRRKKAA